MRCWHAGDRAAIDSDDLELLIDAAKRHERRLAQEAKRAR